jgi:hypothetical protein
MKESKRKDAGPHLMMAIVIAELGTLLIALGGWDAFNFETRMLICVCGSITFLGGLLLNSMAVVRNEPALIPRGSYLGKFQLNGYLFEAYEQGADHYVREFRLLSSPSVDPAQEAAFIRYLVREGLIESMWPEISRQIEESAKWAFLPSPW